MEDKHTFEHVRADVEERQKNILWEDAQRGGRSVDAYLWKGDPHAKPIQRAGLIVFGLMFLFPAIMVALTLYHARFEERDWIGTFMMLGLGLGALLISLRLFRNACLRPRDPERARHE